MPAIDAPSPLRKKKKRQPALPEPAETANLHASFAVHELDQRLSAFSPAFVRERPDVVSQAAFSPMTTPEVARLGLGLSGTWQFLRQQNSLAGIPGALLPLRAAALREPDPRRRTVAQSTLDFVQSLPEDLQLLTHAIVSSGGTEKEIARHLQEVWSQIPAGGAAPGFISAAEFGGNITSPKEIPPPIHERVIRSGDTYATVLEGPGAQQSEVVIFTHNVGIKYLDPEVQAAVRRARESGLSFTPEGKQPYIFSDPDTRKVIAQVLKRVPGAQLSFVSPGLFGELAHGASQLANVGGQVLAAPFTAIGAVIPPARGLLEAPANFLGHIGSDIGGEVANVAGVSSTDPLYDDIRNIGALIVQIGGLKLLATGGAAVKLARSEPREAVIQSIEPGRVEAAGEAEGVKAQSPEDALRRHFGGPLSGHLGKFIFDLASTPIERWFDKGPGLRLVNEIEEIKTHHGAQASGRMIESLKNMDPDLAHLLSKAADRNEIRRILSDRVSKIDWGEVKRLKARKIEIDSRIRELNAAKEPVEGPSVHDLVSEKVGIEAKLDAIGPDEITWELPKPSLVRRVMNRAPKERTKLMPGKPRVIERMMAAIYDPQTLFGIKRLPVGIKPEAVARSGVPIPDIRASEGLSLEEGLAPPSLFGKVAGRIATKKVRLSTFRPMFDDMADTTIHSRGDPSLPHGGLEMSAEYMNKFMRRAGVSEPVIKQVLTQYAEHQTEADYFAVLKRFGAALEDSPYVAADMARTLGNIWGREETERTFGIYHERSADGTVLEPRDVLVDSETEQVLPSMTAEMARPVRGPSVELAIDATSYTRTLTRSMRKVYREERGAQVKYRFTPQAALARGVLLPFDTLRFIANTATVLLKPLVLVVRSLGALPLRIQGEQYFRNYFGGRKGLVREAFKGEEHLPVDVGALGAITRQLADNPVGTKFTYGTERFRGINPGMEVPQAVLNGVYRRFRMWRESPEMRMLARLGPEDWAVWMENAGKGYADIFRPTLERAGVSIAEWGQRKWRELQDLTGGDPRLADAIVRGRWARRGYRVEDSIRAELHDETVAREYDRLVTEELQAKDQFQRLIAEGRTSDALAIQDIISENLARQAEIEGATTASNLNVSLDDEWAFKNSLQDAFNTEEWKPPRTVPVQRLAVDEQAGRLENASNFRSWWLKTMYSGRFSPFRIVTASDIRGTRGSLFYQIFRERFSQAVARGLEPERAKSVAVWRAARETSDLMYDLAARSSFHRFVKNVFWFLPAYQEMLTTWGWKLPSRSYWPIGMAQIVGDAHALTQFLKNEGFIHTDANGDDVLRLSWLRPLLGPLLPADTTLGDAGKDKSVIYGFPSGLNLVSSGLPGISSIPAIALGQLARKQGGMYKKLSDVFLPYGMDISVGPSALNYAYEALTGEAPPWEVFSADYQKQVHDLAMDDAMAMAYHTLADQNIRPPEPSAFPDTSKGNQAYIDARKKYLHQWEGESRSIYQGRAWVKTIGAMIFPLQLHITDTYRQSMSRLLAKVFGANETGALFTEEGSRFYGRALAHNKEFAVPGPWKTELSSDDETAFRAWVANNKIPFDVSADVADYDMRGYWQSEVKGKGQAWQGGHFPDTWKTPYDTSFSKESKYATKNNPFVWSGNKLVDKRSGAVVFGPDTSALTEAESALLDDWLGAHPDGVAYRAYRTMRGDKTRDLAYTPTEDEKIYADFYTHAREVLTPEQFAGSVMGMESRRKYTGQLNQALADISPTLNPAVLLSHGYKRVDAITDYALRWDRWRYLNPDEAARQDEQFQRWAESSGQPTGTAKIHRLIDTLRGLRENAKLFTVNGVRTPEYKAVQNKIIAALSESGVYGPPTTAVEKAFDWFHNKVSNPYYDQIVPLINKAQKLSDANLDPAPVYDKIRGYAAELEGKKIRGPDGKMVTLTSDPNKVSKPGYYPTPELSSWGNLSPEEQRVKRLHYITEPIGWLTPFQRQTAGFEDVKGADELFAHVSQVDARLDHLIAAQNVSSSSNLYDTLQQQRDSSLTAYIKKNYGDKGLALWRLSEAPPYERLAAVGVGKGSKIFEDAVKAARYISRVATQRGYSPKSNSEFMDYYRNWFFPALAEIQNPKNPKYNKEFDNLMDRLGMAMAAHGDPMRTGASLYDALFFNVFTSFYQPSPEAEKALRQAALAS